MHERDAQLAQLVSLLRGRRIAVLTGAGVSTDSGIPDYRGPKTRKLEPRPSAHARMMERTPRFDAQVLAVAPDGDVELDAGAVRAFDVAPCRRCGGPLKPRVVFFGGAVPKATVSSAYAMLEAAEALRAGIGMPSCASMRQPRPSCVGSPLGSNRAEREHACAPGRGQNLVASSHRATIAPGTKRFRAKSHHFSPDLRGSSRIRCNRIGVAGDYLRENTPLTQLSRSLIIRSPR